MTVVLVLSRQGTAIRNSNVFERRIADDAQDDKDSKKTDKGSLIASPAPYFSKMPSVSLPPSCGDGMQCDDPAPKVENKIDDSSHGELSFFNPSDRIFDAASSTGNSRSRIDFAAAPLS
jgi:hypothetical protein